MIAAIGLTKKYGDFEAVRNLTLEIYSGELFGLLGPNGAGKTTTIRMLTGQLPITSGQAKIDGLDVVTHPHAIKKIISYLAENPFLYEKMTGREFLNFVGSMYDVDYKQKEAKIDSLLDLFEMTDVQNELIETYSNGMRKKIAICSTLVHSPKVLFWDEPTRGLDPKSAFIVKELMKRLCRKGATIFFTTHILEIAENLCDRVGIINQGKLEALGSLQELRHSSDESLEQVFLKLTGEVEAGKIERILNWKFL
ncbi:MAG: ABC transporter ATP-binding protein [Thermodesulfobacteriota bacterium]